MKPKIKLQCFIEQEQRDWIEKERARLDMSQGELIRKILYDKMKKRG